DSIIAVGGIIRRFVKSGAKVHVFCFGNNDEAYTSLSAQTAAVERGKIEAVAAHRIIGASSFECHGLPDFGVQRNRDTYHACIRAIRKCRPDIILGHYWREYFQHRDMARLTCDSWWQAGWACSAELGRPWRTRAMYHFEVLHDLPDPTHIVDITDTFRDKIRAFREFEEETAHMSGMLGQIEARARFHGSKIGVKYAEVLRQSFFVPNAVNEIKEL
ncbi:MAG: PIG-L family deacetylase, partial [Kiritimatiellia bacterium]